MYIPLELSEVFGTWNTKMFIIFHVRWDSRQAPVRRPNSKYVWSFRTLKYRISLTNWRHEFRHDSYPQTVTATFSQLKVMFLLSFCVLEMEHLSDIKTIWSDLPSIPNWVAASKSLKINRFQFDRFWRSSILLQEHFQNWSTWSEHKFIQDL